MATFTITHRQRLDGYAVVQTLEATDIGVGQSITISGNSDGLNGTYTVLDVPVNAYVGTDEQGDWMYDPEYIILNQLLIASAGDPIDRNAGTGTITWTQTCTWVTVANVEEFLGIAAATANDTAFLTTAVAAANAWCFRRRQQAGYHDSLGTVPDGSVKLGTVLYAAGLYRERGTTGDVYQQFSDMGGPQMMTLGRVNQLLGVKRSQVA